MMDNQSAPPPTTAAGGSSNSNHPFALMLNMGIQGVRLLRMITLILITLFFWRLIISDPLHMDSQEVAVLRTLQHDVQSGPSVQLAVTPAAAGAETGPGYMAWKAIKQARIVIPKMDPLWENLTTY